MGTVDTPEPPLRTVFVALFVAAIAIAAFLVPMPPAEVPLVHEPVELTTNVAEAAEQEASKADEADSDFAALADAIIDCESTGRNVEIIDTNGKWSRGIAQFQDQTWAWMSEEAGVTGSPLEPEKAREVLLWALENGHAGHWTCYYKVTQA